MAAMVKTETPGIYRRGSKYVVVFRDSNGRQRKESAPNLKAARSLKAARLSARDRGELRSVVGKATFDEACAEWLRYCEHDRQRRPTTLRGYRNVVDTHLLPEFGTDTPLERITTERVDVFRERLLEGDWSRRSVQLFLTLLHGVFARAKRRGWVLTNPVENAEKVAVKRSGEFNVLSPAEALAVARAAESEDDAALFTVAAFTGLRLGELRALRWADVDFALATIRVQRSFTHGQPGPPKSGLVRSVPLIDQAARALDGLSRREHFTAPADLVFCRPTGAHRDDCTLRRAFNRALAAAGLGHKREEDPPLRFHDLRHTFGTLAVRVWPLVDVQSYMGHADIQTTMIYAHHVPRQSAAAELTKLVDAESGNAIGNGRVPTPGNGPVVAASGS